MLKVSKLTKYFGEKMVLNKITFNLEKGNKVALTGFNGSGKTTLLNILTGNESFSNGTFEIQKGIKVGFLPQDTAQYNNKNVLEFIKEETGKNDDKFLRQLEVMFAGFFLPTEIKAKKIGDLSSGQKTKVFLSAILLKEPELLFLDEPTNNLDLPALIWLEDYLKKIDAGFLVVSHDRIFLDQVANKIFEIDWDDHTLKISYAKKYSNYLAEKKKEHERLHSEHEQQKEEFVRLKEIKETKEEKAVLGSKWRGTDNDRILIGFKRNRASKSFRDAKVIHGRMKRIEFVKPPKERSALEIDLSLKNKDVSRNIEIKKLISGYDDGFAVGPFSLDLPFKKRVCFIGANGSGKSTILKTITGKIPAISGEIKIDSGVKFGNFMQEHESLPKNKTPLEFFAGNTNTGKELVYNHLMHFGFSEHNINSLIENLSPGERARLLFAYFSAMNINVLILDEPTNHLDMEAEEAVEKSINEFEGTVICVSHDRYFVERIKFDEYYVVSDEGVSKTDSIKEYVEKMENRSRKLLRMLGK